MKGSKMPDKLPDSSSNDTLAPWKMSLKSVLKTIINNM